MPIIRFYYFDEMLGLFNCPEMSTEEERRKIAEERGIKKWTHFILDKNRVMGFKLKESKKTPEAPLTRGDYLVAVQPDCTTNTIKLKPKE